MIQRTTLIGLALVFVASIGFVSSAARGADESMKSRHFTFTYSTDIKGLSKGDDVRVWLPVPPSNSEQTIKILDRPADATVGDEARFGNRMLFVKRIVEADGTISLAARFDVSRTEIRGDSAPESSDPQQFLKADAKVPVGGKTLKLLDGRSLPSDQLQAAHMLYDVVDDHMVYRKDKPGWGNGDAEWACDSGYGNCTDFHSLFISLARATNIPAKFEIGFLLPEQRGSGTIAGYHCWAKFKPEGHGWMPVDISEANQHPEQRTYNFGNLTENRVTFSVGRDLILEPKQAGPPVNFFVYPYVEVNGKVIEKERIEKRFAFEDMKD